MKRSVNALGIFVKIWTFIQRHFCYYDWRKTAYRLSGQKHKVVLKIGNECATLGRAGGNWRRSRYFPRVSRRAEGVYGNWRSSLFLHTKSTWFQGTAFPSDHAGLLHSCFVSKNIFYKNAEAKTEANVLNTCYWERIQDWNLSENVFFSFCICREYDRPENQPLSFQISRTLNQWCWPVHAARFGGVFRVTYLHWYTYTLFSNLKNLFRPKSSKNRRKWIRLSYK